MISVENLAFDYPGKRVLKNLSFHIPPNQITALVGPNGAGKTTLMRCLAALQRPHEGKITIGGIDILEHPREHHLRLGYLSDFYGMFDQLTVWQSLLYAGASRGLDGDELAQRAETVAHELDLMDFLLNKCKQLSRGQRQRTGIAQAIINKPSFLLLDEPASGLDPEARIALSELLIRLRTEQGMSILVSSHILSELEDYSTEMLVMHAGEIVEHVTMIVDKEADPSRRLLVRLAYTVEGIEDWLVTLPGIDRVVAVGEEVQLSFTGDRIEQAGFLKAMVVEGAPVISLEEVKQDMQAEYLKTVKARA